MLHCSSLDDAECRRKKAESTMKTKAMNKRDKMWHNQKYLNYNAINSWSVEAWNIVIRLRVEASLSATINCWSKLPRRTTSSISRATMYSLLVFEDTEKVFRLLLLLTITIFSQSFVSNVTVGQLKSSTTGRRATLKFKTHRKAPNCYLINEEPSCSSNWIEQTANLPWVLGWKSFA